MHLNVFVYKLNKVKLTRVIQMWKNLHAIKMVLIIFTFMYRISQNIADMFCFMSRNHYLKYAFFKHFKTLLKLLHFSKKLKNDYAFRLFVCPFVCACSNSRKYSSYVVKFICVVHLWYRMNCRKNWMHGAKGSSTETH